MQSVGDDLDDPQGLSTSGTGIPWTFSETSSRMGEATDGKQKTVARSWKELSGAGHSHDLAQRKSGRPTFNS